jgi:hypothetical protein
MSPTSPLLPPPFPPPPLSPNCGASVTLLLDGDSVDIDAANGKVEVYCMMALGVAVAQVRGRQLGVRFARACVEGVKV